MPREVAAREVIVRSVVAVGRRLRIPILVASVLLGILAVPVECSLAAGPHSLFTDPAALTGGVDHAAVRLEAQRGHPSVEQHQPRGGKGEDRDQPRHGKRIADRGGAVGRLTAPDPLVASS